MIASGRTNRSTDLVGPPLKRQTLSIERKALGRRRILFLKITLWLRDNAGL